MDENVLYIYNIYYYILVPPGLLKAGLCGQELKAGNHIFKTFFYLYTAV